MTELIKDELDYEVKFHNTFETSDGRKFDSFTLKPVTVGDYEMVMDVDNPFAQAKKLVTYQMGVTPDDLKKMDNRDLNQMLGVVAHFLPLSLL